MLKKCLLGLLVEESDRRYVRRSVRFCCVPTELIGKGRSVKNSQHWFSRGVAALATVAMSCALFTVPVAVADQTAGDMTVESVTESTQSSQRDDESDVSFINTESRLNDAAPQSAAVTAEQSMDFAVAGGEYGKDYEYTPNTDTAQSGVLTLHPSSESVTLTVSMAGSLRHPSVADSAATKDRIVVTPVAGVPANVVLDGVRINLSKDVNINAAAFSHTSGKLNLTLASKSKNELISGSNHAGLEKNDIDNKPSADFALTIDSQGSGKDDWGALLAQSYGVGMSAYGAGIGGSCTFVNSVGGCPSAAGGSYITIAGGIVTAQSYSSVSSSYGHGGAGIGGGVSQDGSHITIAGGIVTAQSHGAGGAGIGGASNGNGSDITIAGGYVSAASSQGSAVGAGKGGRASSVSITGGYFADTSDDAVLRNKVYGVTPADGYEVMPNAGDDKGTYPVRVMTAASVDFVMSGGSPGRAADYHVEQSIEGDLSSPGVLMIHPQSADTTLTITMSGTLRHQSTADSTATKDRIVVAPVAGVPANVVLKNVKINLSKDTSIDAAAFSHTSGKLTLTLAKNSENKLVSGPSHAGLEKNDLDSGPSEAFALTITSEGSGEADWGSLFAQSYSELYDVWDAGNVMGAGIGGGNGKDSSYITIAGGEVVAQSYSARNAAYGAGIGGGAGGGAGSYITVSGGVVTARSYSGNASAWGAGIGGGAGDSGDGSYITVSGGVVKAESYSESWSAYGAGIGGGRSGDGSDITVSDGRVSVGSKQGSAIGSGEGGGFSSVSITGGYFADTSADALSKNIVYGVAPADDCDVIANDGNDKDTYPIRVVPASPVDFVVAGGEAGKNADYHVVAPSADDASSTGVLVIHPRSADTTLTVTLRGRLRNPSSADSAATKDRIVVTPINGVPANVVLNGVRIDLSRDVNIDAAAFSHTSGKLNLTLASKSKNELISGSNHAGLEKNDIDGKPSEDFALTITSEGSSEADWGSLTAQSDASATTYKVAYGAGIGGGGKGRGSSHITVEGGVIDARSYGAYPAGAGIGGGDGGDGVHIAVTGGTVTAQSYSESNDAYGAGIGGGDDGTGSDITISGGAVTAQSYGHEGAYGAGIGGGQSGSGSNVVITGGSVKAIDGTYNGASTTPQPTDDKGNNVYLAVVSASADHRTVRSCAASGDCADTSGVWKTDWKIDGTHVNTDGSADANLYLWLPGTRDQFVQTSSSDSSYTPYRAVYTGENQPSATNLWQWFTIATSSTYTLSIPQATVSMDEDTTGDSAEVKVTNVKLVDPNRKLSIFGSVVNDTGDDWTSSDGLKLTRSDGNAALRSIVTGDSGNQLGSESPLLNNIGDDSTAATTLHFAKPTVDGDSTASIPAGIYAATLTFAITESRQ